MIWKRVATVETRAWRRALLEVEWRKMRRCETRACTQATVTIAVSDVDRALLAAAAPGARVFTVPTGVDTSYFAPTGVPESPARLVFIGSMDWYPNEDAMVFFIGEILPVIRRAVPDVEMTVVGRDPSERLRALGEAAGVRITGTVEDVRPWIADAAVYVVPLRVGGGTRLKIFEGLAMGKAVVSTTVGAEGLPLVDGTHFVRADGPAEFARAVVSLLRDRDRRRALGTAGRHPRGGRDFWAPGGAGFGKRGQPALGPPGGAGGRPAVARTHRAKQRTARGGGRRPDGRAHRRRAPSARRATHRRAPEPGAAGNHGDAPPSGAARGGRRGRHDPGRREPRVHA